MNDAEASQKATEYRLQFEDFVKASAEDMSSKGLSLEQQHFALRQWMNLLEVLVGNMGQLLYGKEPPHLMDRRPKIRGRAGHDI